jgi:hypothetical protein
MSLLKFSKWEVKRSLSPRFLVSLIVLGASIMAIFLFYRPDVTESMVLQRFYTVGLGDTPEMREIGGILELSPLLDIHYSDGNNFDVVFNYVGNSKINAFMSGSPKSLITFYHIVNTIRALSGVYMDYPAYVLEPVLVNTQNIDDRFFFMANQETPDSVIPSSLPQFEPFTNVTQIIFLLLPIILLASIYSLSLMSEKVMNKITFILLTPFSRLEILFGKMIPYLVISLAFSGFMAFLSFSNWPVIFLILLIVNLNFFSIAMLIPLVSRSFKEYSFLSTFTYFSFFFLLIFPNIMYGLSTASNLSPLSLLNDAALGKEVLVTNVLLSFLPFIWLSISITILSMAVFQEEIFLSKKNFFWMAKKAFSEIQGRIRNRYALVAVSMFLIIPFIYFAEIILSMVIAVFPVMIGIPMMVISFAAIEESFKIMPFIGKKTRWLEGAFAGLMFFLLEKGVNVYIFLSSIESLSLYSHLVMNIWMTLLMHVITTMVLFTAIGKSRKPSLFVAILLHAVFNFMILGVVLNV